MKIIVIGNGYDLKTGLPSSFYNFYCSSYKTNNKEWDNSKIRRNVWRLLLYLKYIDGIDDGVVSYTNDNPRWMDIEGFICDVLNDNGLLRQIDRAFTFNIKRIQPDGKILSRRPEDQAHELYSLIQNKRDDYGYNDVFELLKDDLTEIESDFIKYLDSQTSIQYLNESSKLMSKLTKHFQETYVITFNYTKLPAGLKDVNQVHGSLAEDKIIIGVDKSKLKSNELKKMRFTKSWKKLAYFSSSSKLPQKDEVDEIVIFGHSLGEQDYSYFDSLFNS